MAAVGRILWRPAGRLRVLGRPAEPALRFAPEGRGGGSPLLPLRQDFFGAGAPSAGVLPGLAVTGAVFALSLAGGGVLDDRSLKDMNFSFSCQQ